MQHFVMIGLLLFSFNKSKIREEQWIMEEPREEKPKVLLSGQDGNAFNIMGLCKKAWFKAGRSEYEWKKILKEMQSGDYDHLLQTAMKYFEVD